jgi:hypothetical protein
MIEIQTDKLNGVARGQTFVYGEEHLKVLSFHRKAGHDTRYALCERVGRKGQTKYVQVTKLNGS